MVEQLMYRPAEAAEVLDMGRTSVFALLKSGRLRSVKLGGARYITAEALRAFVASSSTRRPASQMRRWPDARPETQPAVLDLPRSGRAVARLGHSRHQG